MKNQTISNYQILEQLGNSGSGDVYLAHDIELNRKVVLKFLPSGAGSDPDSLSEFVHEAKTAAGLDHPNIVTVYKVGEHLGRPFVAMEYVKGQTLADLIVNESIAPHDAASIAIQICEGLSEAHKNGIHHRDIKPDNILVGRGGRVRIAAFGFSAGVNFSNVLTDSNKFQSPERVRGEDSDERSDVYAVGALLNELSAEDQFKEIISRAMSEQPADRHATVEELATDLVDVRGRQVDDLSRKSLAARAINPLAITIFLALIATVLLRLNPFEQDATVKEEPRRQVIAVLPFANLGGAEDEYFADGITDEITARLSRMQDLGVISRTSTRIYKGTQKPVREIGSELNADYIIEGTIRWDKSHDKGRVRITPQLIRVSDDTHVWGNNYEREITEIFAVQADIAERIVEALDVTLLEDEKQTLAAQPTRNIDAYQAYLLGMKQLNTPGFSRELFELGVKMFERAIELDPDFALAYARLSSLHSRIYHYGYDRTDQRLDRAKAAVDRAFSLQPDLVEAHVALGYYYYWGLRDYERALASLVAAKNYAPNSHEIMQATAYVKRRQGDLEASVELIERSLELSPIDATATVTLGETYGTLRQYSDGERSLKRSIALAPDDGYPYTELALLYLRWRGDTTAARTILETMPSASSTEYYRVGFLIELLDHDYQAALDYLDACPKPVLEAGAFFIPIPLYEGITLQLMGELDRARVAFEDSRLILEEKIAQEPDDYRVHSTLGVTYAVLDRAADAIRHGERAVDLYPMSRDALEAPVMIIDLALTYALAGDHEAALERLDYVLSIPSILSVPWLEKDPRWDSLRQNPQFTKLLQKYRIDPRS